MASISPLPIELFIHIVTIALDTSNSDEFAKVGHNAAWKEQDPSGFEFLTLQHSRPHTPLDDILPFPDGVNEGVYNKDELSTERDSREEKLNFFATARALRL
jgi:hypothetical protein